MIFYTKDKLIEDYIKENINGFNTVINIKKKALYETDKIIKNNISRYLDPKPRNIVQEISRIESEIAFLNNEKNRRIVNFIYLENAGTAEYIEKVISGLETLKFKIEESLLELI